MFCGRLLGFGGLLLGFCWVLAWFCWISLDWWLLLGFHVVLLGFVGFGGFARCRRILVRFCSLFAGLLLGVCLVWVGVCLVVGGFVSDCGVFAGLIAFARFCRFVF